jgi:hypothetical protein
MLGVVGGGRGGLVGGGGLGVHSGALVGHIGDIAVVAVGGVLDMLDAAVGEGHGVGAGNVGGTVGLLLSVESGLGVVVSHGVGEGVGGDLIGVHLGLVSGSWLVGWGSNNHGLVDGMSNNGSVVDDGGVVGHGVGNDGGVVNGVMGDGVDGMMDWGVVHGMSYWGNGVEGDNGSLAHWDGSVGGNGGLDLGKTLGVVSLGHRGVGGSEGFALAESSDLSVSGGD